MVRKVDADERDTVVGGIGLVGRVLLTAAGLVALLVMSHLFG